MVSLAVPMPPLTSCWAPAQTWTSPVSTSDCLVTSWLSLQSVKKSPFSVTLQEKRPEGLPGRPQGLPGPFSAKVTQFSLLVGSAWVSSHWAISSPLRPSMRGESLRSPVRISLVPVRVARAQPRNASAGQDASKRRLDLVSFPVGVPVCPLPFRIGSGLHFPTRYNIALFESVPTSTIFVKRVTKQFM